METKETSEQKFEQIKEDVISKSIHISRIPLKTRDNFIALADNEFDGDFGFCLKFLMDYYQGLFISPNQTVLDKVDFLADEIVQIKSAKSEPKRKIIKSVSGKTIIEKEMNENE